MFKNSDQEGQRDDHQADDTIIGSTIKIEGDLVSNGNIVVEGEVVGSLKTEKHLRIGQNAKVKADVKASEALISGNVDGNITVDGKLELTESARVTGDIKSKVLIIQPGALLNGNCTMEGGVNLVEKKTTVESDVEQQ